MKILKFIGLLIVLIMTEASIHADELRIVVVNVGTVLERLSQKTQTFSRLEKEFLFRSESLERQHQDLLEAQRKLAKDSAILSAIVRKSEERTILSDQRELKRLQDEYNEDLSIRRNEELRRLEKEIAEIISNLARKESYDLVVYQGFIYFSERIDITDKVLKLLKEKIE